VVTDGRLPDPTQPSPSRSHQSGPPKTESTAPRSKITTSTGSHSGIPDEFGFFPRINIARGERVNVSVSYPEAQPGDLVIVQADDGGDINNDTPVGRFLIDQDRNVNFSFGSTEEGGIYRVTLRRGYEEKRLQFFGDNSSSTLSTQNQPDSTN